MAALPAYENYTDDLALEFYLGASTADELAASADAVFLVEGRALPVHSSVLAAAGGVLAKAAAARAAAVGGGADGAAAGGAAAANGGPAPMHHSLASTPHLGSTYHLSASGAHLDVVLSDQIPAGSERSLEGLTLKRLAHFLRWMYFPEEIDRLDYLLPGAAKSMSAAARLAHQLDMQGLLERLDAKMEATVGSHQATMQRLMDWVAVAEECGLKRLFVKCIREICLAMSRARKGVGPRTVSSQDLLTHMPGSTGPADGMHTAVHDATLLAGLSARAHLAIVATLLASLRRTPGDPADLVPAESCLAAALPALRVSESPVSEMAQ